MLDIFSGLRLVIKRRSISIDNAIFRCHWFFTSTLLLSFSLIITARQYVGQSIECHSVNKISESLLNSFCWVQSTFTVPQACSPAAGPHPQAEFPYPCIDNSRGREVKVYAYYQWVGIVLFIQGLLFHLPYYLWKVWENGLIRAITGGLRVAVISDQERAKKKDIVVEYIHDHLGCHKRYALKYFLCEFICLINLILQLWATNKFFDGQFLRYGLDVMQYSSLSLAGLANSVGPSQVEPSGANSSQPADQMAPNPSPSAIHLSQQQLYRARAPVDPMSYIFPRMTKCTYFDFGSSGDVQKHDALCLLPLNIINEKIYIALWFWFLILALLTLLVIVYRILAMFSESIRCQGLLSRCKLSSERDIRIICRHCDVGDWFLFYMVAENLDPILMREIITAIADKIRLHFQLKRELGVLDESHFVQPATSCYKLKPYDQLDGDHLIERYGQTGTPAASHYPASPFFGALLAAPAPPLAQPSAPPASLDVPPASSVSSPGSGSTQRAEALSTAEDHDRAAPLLSRRRIESARWVRRSSLPFAIDETLVPLVRRSKRRLYSKRLWSVDLGSRSSRQYFCLGNGQASNCVAPTATDEAPLSILEPDKSVANKTRNLQHRNSLDC